MIYKLTITFLLSSIVVVLNEILFYYTFKQLISKITKSKAPVNCLYSISLILTFLFFASGLAHLASPTNRFIIIVHCIAYSWIIPKLFLLPIFIIYYIYKFVISKKKKKNISSNSNSINLGRRKFLSLASWGILTIPAVSLMYKSIIHPYQFHRKNIEIQLLNFPEELDGFRILQISNLQLGNINTPKMLKEMVDIINDDISPDLIFFTGNLTFTNYIEIENYIKYLSQMQARYCKFAILGTNDKDKRIPKLLEKAEIFSLDNDICILNTYNTPPIQIAGINTANKKSKNKIESKLKDINPELPCFLLVNDYDSINVDILKKYPVNIVFTNSTDTKKEIFPYLYDVFQNKYILKQQNSKYLYVNSGTTDDFIQTSICKVSELAVFDIYRIKDLI